MRNKFGVGLLLLLGAAVLLPLGSRLLTNEPSPERIGPRQELSAKHYLMQNDISRTDSLCRTSCKLDLEEASSRIDHSDLQITAQQLQELVAEHPHMRYIAYTCQSTDKASAGAVDDELRKQAEMYVNEARVAVQSGGHYESPTFDAGGKPYFVLGVPAEKSEGGIIGIVEQTVLQEVGHQQALNLRIVPYPSSGRFGIKAVDPHTLQQVEVDHPEDNEGVSHYYKGEVVVKFRTEPSETELERMRSEIGAGNVQKLGYTYVFSSDRDDTEKLLQYFEKVGVEYAEPHFLYVTNTAVPQAAAAPQATTPNDTLYARYQWNLPIIATPTGWSVTTGSEKVTVAVIDTGVDLNHPDLRGHLLPGLNAVGRNTTPQDDVGHGTHVAGVIGAITNNGQGIAGMTWNNSILPIKVLDHTGAGSTYTVAQGIVWATDNGAKVINLSLGNYANARFLHDAIKYAFDRDVVLIAASGNDNTQQPGYPAAYPEVFAVAATDSRNKKATFSNFGDYIDVAAPGVGIASTYTRNQYAALSGTSMASPHVAALAALIRSANPGLKNTEVYEVMRRTAQDLGDPGKDMYFGHGLIHVERALQLALQSRRSLLMQDDLYARELRGIEHEIARQRRLEAAATRE